MKKKFIFVISIVLAVSLAICFMIHTDNKSDVIGRWYKSDGTYIEFFQNGIWECAEEFEGYGGTWKIKGTKLYLTDLLGNYYTGILQSHNKSLTLKGDIYTKSPNYFNNF